MIGVGIAIVICLLFFSGVVVVNILALKLYEKSELTNFQACTCAISSSCWIAPPFGPQLNQGYVFILPALSLFFMLAFAFTLFTPNREPDRFIKHWTGKILWMVPLVLAALSISLGNWKLGHLIS